MAARSWRAGERWRARRRWAPRSREKTRLGGKSAPRAASVRRLASWSSSRDERHRRRSRRCERRWRSGSSTGASGRLASQPNSCESHRRASVALSPTTPHSVPSAPTALQSETRGSASAPLEVASVVSVTSSTLGSIWTMVASTGDLARARRRLARARRRCRRFATSRSVASCERCGCGVGRRRCACCRFVWREA